MTQTPSQNQRWTLWQVVVGASVIFGLISAVVAIWGFFFNRETASFVYDIADPITVFESGVSSNFSVVGKDGQMIKDNIYLQEVIFWNAGNQPIEPDLVRIPITVNLVNPEDGVNPARILESRITNQTQAEIVRATVKEVGAVQTLRLGWQHLDPGQGATVQIVYTTANEEALDVRLAGQIVGIPRLFSVYTSPIERVAPWIPGWLFLILLFTVPTAAVFTVFWVVNKLNIKKEGTSFLVQLVAAFLVMVLFTLLLVSPFRAPLQPQYRPDVIYVGP